MSTPPVIWDREELIARGFTPAGVPTQPDMPGFGRLRSLASQFDRPTASLTAFRTAPDQWEVFFLPGTTKERFTDHPLLT